MPTLSEFFDTLERSRLVDQHKVDSLRARLGDSDRNDTAAVAKALVEKRLLTKFQAKKILDGKAGPFYLGKYKIRDQIGAGGMGKVFLARHTETRKKVAIKVLPPKRAAAERNALARFRREANLGQRLSHMHIAQTIEIGEENGVYFIVMEYIAGMSLFDIVQQGGPLRVWDAARIFSEIADGLNQVHEAGIVHRDIKPSNIMVTPDGVSKLLDLGLARATDEEDEKQLTREGTVVGTMDYIAPEQASGAGNADARSDIYSLGCTLYLALVGRPPFSGGDLISKIYRQRMEDPEPIETKSAGVPKEFGALVRKMMAKDPSDRYATAAELSADLKRWTNADFVRGFVGSAADSGQLFRPPPPELESAELQIEGVTLRDLGADQPTEAPGTVKKTLARQKADAPTKTVDTEPARPKPLQRTKATAQRAEAPNEATAAYFLIGAIVVIGLIVGVLLFLFNR